MNAVTPKTKTRPSPKPAAARQADDLLKQATRAMKAKDWQKATEHWVELRMLGARAVPAYDQAARALIHLDRTEEAESLVLEGIKRFPKNAALAMRHAALPEYRKDWPQAVTRWSAFHDRFKGTAYSHLQHAKVLILNGQMDDAEALLRIAAQRWPEDTLIATEQAGLAVSRNDWALALERWRTLRSRFEDSARAAQGECEALIALGLHEEAESLLQSVTSRYPDHPGLMMQHATVATQRQDWATACERWAVFRQRFGNRVDTCEQEVHALIHCGQTERAEQLLLDATRRFPNRRPLALKLAHLAAQRHDWLMAAERWKLLRKRFPPTVDCFREEAHALVQLEQADEADTVLAQAMRRWPRDQKLARQWAELAMSREDWPTAASRWQRIRKKYPKHPIAYLRGIRALIQQSEFDQAESLLEAALTRFPHKSELIAWRSEISLAREQTATTLEWKQFYQSVLDGRLPPVVASPVNQQTTLPEPPPVHNPDKPFWRGWLSKANSS